MVSIKIGKFYLTFRGAVQEQQSAPELQEIHYPKKFLKEEAYRVFSLLPTTEAFHDAAIQLLKDRYDNEILIAKAHLNGVSNIDSIKKSVRRV